MLALDLAADKISDVLVLVAGPVEWLFALSLLSLARVELVDGIKGDPLDQCPAPNPELAAAPP